MLVLYALYFIVYLIIYPQGDLMANIVGVVVPSVGAVMSDAKVIMGFTHMITLAKQVGKNK